ncbi:hypothetical protein, partial [Pantoea eucalypti]|uniref:hypothetical protein n=1 Tax=Pantoea eucalypti TaxID=470933 RepID=UPI003FA49A2A
MRGNLTVWTFREAEPLLLRREISKRGAPAAPRIERETSFFLTYQGLTSFTAVSKSVISTSRRPDLREAT